MMEASSKDEAVRGGPVEGRRVLLVEDNYLVAATLVTQLEEMGCAVIGPFASVHDALAAVERESIDAAVLDVNIIGGTSAPVAEALAQRGVPFVFVTGYGSPRMLPPRLASHQRLNKPVNERLFQKTLATVLDRGGAAPTGDVE